MRVVTRLFFSYLVIAFSVILVSTVAVYQTQLSSQQLIQDQSIDLAGKVIGNIDETIDYKIRELVELSQHPVIIQSIQHSNERSSTFDEQTIFQLDDQWRQSSEITPLMLRSIDHPAATLLREKSNIYEQILRFPVFPEIFVTDSYGLNVLQTGRTTDFLQSDEDWWKNAKTQGIYVENVSFDKSANVYSTDISIRIDDEDGNFIGVMKAILNIEDTIFIINEAKDHSSYQSTHLHLIDSQKNLIYSTAQNSTLPAQDVSVMLENYFSVDSLGHGLYPGLGWSLLITHDESEIFANSTFLLHTMIGIAIVIGTVAMIFGYYVSKSITIPLSTLDNYAKNIAHGNLKQKIQINGPDEFVALSNSFNFMSESLQKSSAYIEELKRVETQKNEFISMVSHELKTPLVPIQGYSDLLLGEHLGALTDKQRDRLRIINDSSRSLLNLISDLLDAQKLELGQMRIRKTLSNLDVAITKTINEFTPYAQKNNIVLGYNHNDIVFTHDSERIKQVVSNLVKNALAAVPENTGKVHVTSKLENNNVKIYVADNGIGIPKEKRKNLFKKFYQADTSLTREQGGSGLGLAICKGIIETHKGTISVQDNPGGGTIFTITIPKKPNS